MKSSVILKLQISPIRRILALFAMGFLGILLLYLAITTEMSFLYRVFLVLVAAGFLWTTRAMRRGTDQPIELRSTGLFLADGSILALIEDICKVERGVFAFKPSNGFVVTLNRKFERAWVPGLYWRMGSKIGVGGVTSPAQAKSMADALAALIMEQPG